LKTLIVKESPSVYYIHYSAHQLQLVIVVVAKGNGDYVCVCVFYQLSLLLNIFGVSCKRHGMLYHHQFDNVIKSLESGVLEFRSGLNRGMGFA
jgi:hypothetical protein